LIIAGLCWACCRIAKTSATYEEVFSMSSHVYVVSAVSQLGLAALGRLVPQSALASHDILAMVVGASVASKMIAALYIATETWYYALLGLGLRIVGRVRAWMACAVPIGLLTVRAAFWIFWRHQP
jgi:hypothetical protein